MRIVFPDANLHLNESTEIAAVLVAFSILGVACTNTRVSGMLAVRATAPNLKAPALSSQSRISELCLRSAVTLLAEVAQCIVLRT